MGTVITARSQGFNLAHARAGGGTPIRRYRRLNCPLTAAALSGAVQATRLPRAS
jgi:hypothetical protein